jgi:uncharacterized membrane protein
MKTFSPEFFLEIVDRMNGNMAPVMTVLMPGTMLSIIPVMLFSYRQQPMVFYLSAAALLFFLVALLVTVVVEVPIVQQIITWTPSTLPANWQYLRDRWMKFHVVRVIAGMASLVFLLVAAIF